VRVATGRAVVVVVVVVDVAVVELATATPEIVTDEPRHMEKRMTRERRID
jgi:hypothetical protein